MLQLFSAIQQRKQLLLSVLHVLRIGIDICMKNATMQKHSSTLEEEALPKSLVNLARKPLTVGCLY